MQSARIRLRAVLEGIEIAKRQHTGADQHHGRAEDLAHGDRPCNEA